MKFLFGIHSCCSTRAKSFYIFWIIGSDFSIDSMIVFDFSSILHEIVYIKILYFLYFFVFCPVFLGFCSVFFGFCSLFFGVWFVFLDIFLVLVRFSFLQAREIWRVLFFLAHCFFLRKRKTYCNNKNCTTFLSICFQKATKKRNNSKISIAITIILMFYH